MAGSYVELLWAKTLRAVNSLAAERAYFSMTEHERRAVEESTGYDAWLDAQVSELAFRRKGAIRASTAFCHHALQAAQGPHSLPSTTVEWVAFWTSVAAALPSADELRGSPGNVVMAAAPAAPPPAPEVPASATPAGGKARGAAAAAAPAKAALAAEVSPGGAARPSSRGGAPAAVASAAKVSAPAAGNAPPTAATGAEATAAFTRLRMAAAAVRGVHSPSVLSHQSVRRPLLTIQALRWLVGVLCDAGMSARAAPVLSLWYAVASDLLPSSRACMPVVATALAATAVWADAGGSSAAAANAWSGVLRLLAASDGIERGFFDGELAVAEMQHQQQPPPSDAGADGDASPLAKPAITKAPRRRSTAAGRPGGPGSSFIFRRCIPSSSSGAAAADIPVRVVWANLAAVLARAGYLPIAKRLLIDVRRHAKGFRDSATLRKAAAVASFIAVVEGDFGRVIEDAEALLQPSSGLEDESTAQDWLEVVTLLASALRGKGRHGDVVALLTAAIRGFSDATYPPSVAVGLMGSTAPPSAATAAAAGGGDDADLDAAAACVRGRLALARALVEWASARTSTAALCSPDANVLAGIREAWDAAVAELERAADSCRLLALSPLLLAEALHTKVRVACDTVTSSALSASQASPSFFLISRRPSS